MNVSIPSNVRAALYLLSVFIGSTVAFLTAAGVKLSVWVLALAAGFNAVVAIVARANVTPDTK